MKKFFLFFGVLMVTVFVLPANAQISNLVINSSDTSFTMVSGGTISWQYDIDSGGTANGQIWYDLNVNGVIDTALDKERISFTETDGQSGSNGPGDDDGIVNGQITFSLSLGFAPGHYLLKFSEGGVTFIRKGTIFALSSPSYSFSGKVTPPSGKSPAGIFIQLKRNDNYSPNFWEAITDGDGNYTVYINSDTAGNPWQIRLADHYDPFLPAIVSPQEYDLTIPGDSTGYNFTFSSAAAQVVGYLKDDTGTPIQNGDVQLQLNHDSTNINYDVKTNSSGYFQIGVEASDLSDSNYYLQTSTNNDSISTLLVAQKTIHGIHSGDSLFYNLVSYSVNSTIQGHVLVNGNPPGFRISISAYVTDTADTFTKVDSTTGNFSLPVSNKLYNYQLYTFNLPPGYFTGGNVTAHPGETGVLISITVTSVKPREDGIPAKFALNQNYPNPFNPTTTIDYDIPKSAYVQLSVYNILGQEIVNLVNQEQAPGKYRATLDAASLPSGIYFYRLNAGTNTQLKKMLLMK